ncbi:pectin lyase fold/virulence factor [Xylariaceae sp. FL1651]|nr:pectin lyase fold/virulence factor [Xylariaceae sp. FL1651]
MSWLKSLATASLIALLPRASGLLAFPGAEGFGRNAIGGRTGSIYHVTNLADSGTGSLRDAISQANRIVVFDVDGTINITDRVVVSKNVYIAGQTAPGGGITVYGNGLSWSNANNAIVRYVRLRTGKSGDSGKDSITIADGENMILGHVSVTWGRDETFSINGDVTNVTIQNSIIGQDLGTHSCGGLMQTDGGASLFRNLYIDNKTARATSPAAPSRRNPGREGKG